MGNEPGPILYTDIAISKWYIVEVEAYGGGVGSTGCSRPLLGIMHDVCPSSDLRSWLRYDYDCTDDKTLVGPWGDAQRLIKVFGPYADLDEAEFFMW